MKAHDYAELSSVTVVFLEIPQKYSAHLFKKNLLMNVPFFIKERLWMSDFDETKLKKTFGGSKPFSKWTLKTITTVLAAVMIFEVVNN